MSRKRGSSRRGPESSKRRIRGRETSRSRSCTEETTHSHPTRPTPPLVVIPKTQARSLRSRQLQSSLRALSPALRARVPIQKIWLFLRTIRSQPWWRWSTQSSKRRLWMQISKKWLRVTTQIRIEWPMFCDGGGRRMVRMSRLAPMESEKGRFIPIFGGVDQIHRLVLFNILELFKLRKKYAWFCENCSENLNWFCYQKNCLKIHIDCNFRYKSTISIIFFRFIK